jgi:hypothetical protein
MKALDDDLTRRKTEQPDSVARAGTRRFARRRPLVRLP